MNRRILPALALMVVLAACNKVEQPSGGSGIDSPDSPVMGFSAGSAATKVGSPQTGDFTDGDIIGIYGVYSTQEGAAFADANNVFELADATQLSYDGSAWSYSPLQFWHRNQYYRFRAYYPYSEVKPTEAGVDGITVGYNTLTDNYDLMFAFATRYPATEGTGPVDLNFRHALSAVKFNIAFHPDVAQTHPNLTGTLTEFHLTGLSTEGTVTYSHDPGNVLEETLSWSEGTRNTSDKLYQYSGSKTFGIATGTTGNPGNTTPIYGEGTVLYVIPQVISPSGERRRTTVNFTVDGVDYNSDLPSVTWEPGKLYSYNLLITRTYVVVYFEVKDWDTVRNSTTFD